MKDMQTEQLLRWSGMTDTEQFQTKKNKVLPSLLKKTVFSSNYEMIEEWT